MGCFLISFCLGNTILPLIHRRCCHAEIRCHLFLCHILFFSILSDYRSNLHKSSSSIFYLQGPLLIYIIANRIAMHNWRSVNLSEYLLTSEKESLRIFFRNFIILFFFRHILLTNILYNELIKSKKTTVVFKTLFMAVGLRLTITF